RRDRRRLAYPLGRGVEEPELCGSGARQSGSRAAFRRTERAAGSGRSGFGPGRRQARTHLQPGPRHPSRNAGRERARPGRVRERVEREIRHAGSHAMTQQKTAVLLLAHGSPESPADVPEFMRHVTGGRPIPDAVIEEVRYRHQQIGSSPLTRITMAQTADLQRELGMPVYVGMRNWKPFIADTVRNMLADGVDQVLAICLAPQNSSTSVGLYRKALMAEMKPEIPVRFIDSWHDHPLLVRAFAEKLEPAWRQACQEAGAAVPVIFTAHSVPTRTIQAGDP